MNNKANSELNSAQQDLYELVNQIDEHFNKDELKDLCFALKLDYENLAGEAKKAKCRELVDLCRRHGKLEELRVLLEQVRPELVWESKFPFSALKSPPPQYLATPPTSSEMSIPLGSPHLPKNWQYVIITVGFILFIAAILILFWTKNNYPPSLPIPSDTPTPTKTDTQTITGTSIPAPNDTPMPVTTLSVNGALFTDVTSSPTISLTRTPIAPDSDNRALWLWNTTEVITDNRLLGEFMDFVQNERVNIIYLYAFGLFDSHRQPLVATIETLRTKGIQVELLAGESDWALEAKHDDVLSFVSEADNFTRELAQNGQIYLPIGIHLDIEPYLLTDEWSQNNEELMRQYLGLLVKINNLLIEKNSSLLLAVDMPFWYETSDLLFTYQGETKHFQAHIQDLVDYVTVMDYRDTALGHDGIIEHARQELAYASRIGKPVTIGLETQCLGNEEDKITFCEEGPEILAQELTIALAEFTMYPGFNGFAIHDYRGWLDLATTITPAPTIIPSPAFTTQPLRTPTPNCPTARGAGRIEPDVSIASITFSVDGVNQTISGPGQILSSTPGSQVRVSAVTTCLQAGSNANGSVTIVVVPVVSGGIELNEYAQEFPVSFSRSNVGPSYTWTIGEDWQQFSVVVLHYPAVAPGGDCGGGTCERDDRLIVSLK